MSIRSKGRRETSPWSSAPTRPALVWRASSAADGHRRSPEAPRRTQLSGLRPKCQRESRPPARHGSQHLRQGLGPWAYHSVRPQQTSLGLNERVWGEHQFPPHTRV